MLQSCQDSYCTTFSTYPAMLEYHENQTKESRWVHSKVSELQVEPLDKGSFLYGYLPAFAAGITQEAVEDTANNLGLAVRVNGELYPLRSTAQKGLFDRAKIGGSVLSKLSRESLAKVLNICLPQFQAESLLLIRNEKVSAVHSGDAVDYSVLPVDELLTALKTNLDIRFPGNVFNSGYCDHSLVSASWSMPDQKEELLGTYTKMLASHGMASIADKLIPGIQFISSDTGISSAKVSAVLIGGYHTIHIGGCIALEHRNQSKVMDFSSSLVQLFAQFGDKVAKLQKLLEIELDYPVNAMTRVCKKLGLPKKAAAEAISMYEISYGGGTATAHDVFLAMQEIPFILQTEQAPKSKMIALEETMARALSLKWADYDLAKAVDY